jgi:uncharacterized protein YbaP (TraB family)
MTFKMGRFLRRGIAALAAILALGATPAAAEPALWVLKDHDSTIYLFGTVHYLKPDTRWRSPKIDKALAESAELVLEVAGLEDPSRVAPIMRSYGIDTARTLSSKLTPKERGRLAEAARTIGIPPERMEPMRPWLAALTLMTAPALKAGYDPRSGVENVLTADAKLAGKPISGLETAEQQIRFFADMPEATQIALLEATLDDVDDAATQLDRMVDGWARGDDRALEREAIDEMKRDYPALYEIAVTRRNRAWADQLKTKLGGSGVSFVAVGGAHLVGPDSVIVELEKRGLKVTRR